MSGPGMTAEAAQGSPERALWAAILMQQAIDLCSRNDAERIGAERWIDSGPHFRMVCSLAGVEPDRVHIWLRGIVALPLRERRRRLRRDRFDRSGGGL